MAGWQQFFDEHAPRYLENAFTQNTRAEVDFLIERFQLPSGSTILDLGCGVGRHTIEFARRGWAVTGVDFSSGMLEQARFAADAREILIVDPEMPPARGQIRLIRADVTHYQPDHLYDAVICLCEGGCGLIGKGEDPVAHDLAILRCAYSALRPNALFVLTALNGYALIRQMTDELVQKGRFNPATMEANYEDEWNLPEGKRTMEIRERLFIPPEMVAMLRHVGFQVEHVWGGTAGDWGERPIKLDEVEAMYLCRKR